MPESYLVRGILIGLLFGMPVGAVGAMTVQRTLAYGPKVGVLTAMGASAADCLYAGVGAFGFTFVSDFLLQNQLVLNLAGGALILFMGIRLLLKKQMGRQGELKGTGVPKMFLSSFAVGMTNPAAILTFLFAFSWFGISGRLGAAAGIQLAAGVFAGTLLWWAALSGVVGILKKKFDERRFQNMNKVFGAVLLLFGAVVFLRVFECFLR